MSECLYPTLIADGSLTTPATDNCSTLQRQITSKIDKYLQEAAEKHERDDNYYDGWHVATNTSSPQQEANFLCHDLKEILWVPNFLLYLSNMLSTTGGKELRFYT